MNRLRSLLPGRLSAAALSMRLRTAIVGVTSASIGFGLSVRHLTAKPAKAAGEATPAVEATAPEPAPPAGGDNEPEVSPTAAVLPSADEPVDPSKPHDLVSSHLSAESLSTLKKAFAEYDINGDGHITVAEMRTVLAQKHVLSEQRAAARGELIGMFQLADVNHDDTIDFEEFCSTIKLIEDMKHEFKALDTNGDGKLDAAELTPFVNRTFPGHTGQELIRRATGHKASSKDGSGGGLTFSEWAQLFIAIRRHHFTFNKSQKPVTKAVNASTVGLNRVDGDVAAAAGLNAWLWVDSHIGLKDGLLEVKAASDSIAIQMLLAGTSCGTATVFTLPVDVIKVRMQINARKASAALKAAAEAASAAASPSGTAKYPITFVQTARAMYATEGIRSYYGGASASLLRAYTYSAMRLAFYDPMKGVTGADKHPTLLRKIAAGVLSGSLAATLSNPVEVVKIRMQVDPKRYRNTIVGLYELAKSEGVSGFGAGMTANVLRGGAITATQIASYDHIKHELTSSGLLREGLALHFWASIAAGGITTFVSSPFDVLRTTMMNNKGTPGGFGGCLKAVYAERGVRGLFLGFVPNWLRLGPHTTITMVSFEYLRNAFGYKPM